VAPTRQDLDTAIVAYWATKGKQRKAAEAIKSTAEGTAKEVRGAGHFNPVATLLARFFTDAGYPPDSISASGKKVVLPGYFRPNKAWDLVVVHRGVLVAAIELKALGGRSSGKNFNNRVEEALGNAIDVSHANLNQLTGSEKPWLGYFFLMDDSPKSRNPSQRTRENPALPLENVWKGLSHQQRFAITGRRLVDEGIYDAVCYLVSSPQAPKPIEPDPQLDWRHFSASIKGRLAYLSELGLP
jgi:restriction endonuclease XhoI-like protein